MRSFLGWVVLIALLGAVAYVLAPMVVRPLVADAVRAVSPFGSEPLEVDATVSTDGLLRGTIDSIHVTGADLTSDRLLIGRLDITASGVGVLDRDVRSLTGSLETVAIRRADGMLLQASGVRLSGPSDAVVVAATVGREETIEIVRHALANPGLPAGDVALIDGGVRVYILGRRTDFSLGAVDGGIALAGSLAGGQPIAVFGPEPGDPWQITSVSATPDGLEVHALVDLGAALR